MYQSASPGKRPQLNQNYRNLKMLLLLMVIGNLICTEVLAQGNLLLMPRRIMFEGAKRTEEINLSNIGIDSATYVISLIHIRMNEDGTFQQINQPDSGQFFADKYLRFFPRTVTLAPKESQMVKVQLVRTNELAPGEYRSHIYFRAIPKSKPLGDPEASKDSALAVKITPVFGISIPAIIRVGESNAKVNIAQAKLEMVKDSLPAIKYKLSRNGNMSVYGDIIVDHIALDGTKTQVGVIKGLAIYTPNLIRQGQLLLDRTKPVNFHAGRLRFVYAEQTAGKPVSLAETEIVLN